MKIKMYLGDTHVYVETGIVGLLVNLAWIYWKGWNLKNWEKVTVVFPETPRCDIEEGANNESK